MYLTLKDLQPPVQQKYLISSNLTRPRVTFVLWLACHDRMATKERLCRFGLINDDKCCLCDKKEILQHLMFDYSNMRDIWMKIQE